MWTGHRATDRRPTRGGRPRSAAHPLSCRFIKLSSHKVSGLTNTSPFTDMSSILPFSDHDSPDSSDHHTEESAPTIGSRSPRCSPEFKIRSILELLSGNRATYLSNRKGVSQQLLCIWKRRAVQAIASEFGCDPAVARNLFREFDQSQKDSFYNSRHSTDSMVQLENDEVLDRITSLEGALAELIIKYSQPMEGSILNSVKLSEAEEHSVSHQALLHGVRTVVVSGA